MVQGRRSPLCMNCGKRPVAWPKRRRMFCTVTCAANYGADKGDEKEYCREHKQWYYFDEWCPDCGPDK